MIINTIAQSTSDVTVMGSLCMHPGLHCYLFRWFLGKRFLEVHSYMTGYCTIWKMLISSTKSVASSKAVSTN